MAIKVGINGFGRIGRLVYRAMANDPELDVVAVNDLGDIPTMAHLLKYDSVHGRAFDTVEVTEDGFVADGHATKVLCERDPENLPWGELGVDVVIESTGIFKTGKLASKHINAGAKKVVITCPAKGEDITIVMGVNDGDYDKELTTSPFALTSSPFFSFSPSKDVPSISKDPFPFSAISTVAPWISLEYRRVLKTLRGRDRRSSLLPDHN